MYKVQVITDRPGVDRLRMPIEFWFNMGSIIYGQNRMKWKFKCPACGKVQTAEDFLPYFPNKDEAFIHSFYHCLSRYNGKQEVEGKTCCWKLDGCLRIHKVELICMEEISFAFEFADALVTDEEILMFRCYGDIAGEVFKEDSISNIWKAIAMEGLSGFKEIKEL